MTGGLLLLLWQLFDDEFGAMSDAAKGRSLSLLPFCAVVVDATTNGCCWIVVVTADEVEDNEDDVAAAAAAILPFSYRCHANAAQSKHSVLPVPVGDSRSAFVPACNALTTPFI
jgi:hypothetical protein